MIFGYARVSSEGQHLNSQLEELKTAGCSRIFQEKISGARSDRRELSRLLTKISKGDTVVISRLDRLARSSRDLLNILHEISEKGALFRSLHDAWADTSTPHGRLIVTVLAGLSEFERTLIRTRTSEGIVRARGKGVKFGRKFKLTMHQRREAMERKEQGETLKSIARSYNVSHSTISRLNSGAL